MQPHKHDPVQERPAARPEPELDARFPGKYVSLTTFKRDGTGVATPVWFAIEHGRLLIETDPQSFKVKRIRRNPAVMIAPCTATGRLRGDRIPAKAELLPASQLDHVEKSLGRKYRIDRVLIAPVYRAVRRLRGAHQGVESVALAITPLSSSTEPTSDPS